MKKVLCFVLAFLLLSISSSFASNILYDDTHGQTAGNADWIPSGAYSDMIDMLTQNGNVIDSLSNVSGTKTFTPEVLSKYDALIIAEPNNPYKKEEINNIINFIKMGGGAFVIGDHGHADRNHNGWDAVRALNTFCPSFGFKFKGDFLYEAPLAGKINSSHPVMFGVKAVGVWAGSTFDILNSADASATGLIYSRWKKAPYIVAATYGKGRVVAIGDSSPFDDGTGSGGKNKLHDSYDSFMYSHPQLAYNAVSWVTGKFPTKRIPSKIVNFYNQAKSSEKSINILIDAAHGNAASDKMETFERHMKKLGLKVYYTLNLIRPEMLKNFSTIIIPDPSMSYMDSEIKSVSDWFMKGGNLLIGGSWDASKLRGTNTTNKILENLGSVIRFNDDQVWDKTNKTNRPWGVLSHIIKANNPITEGIKTIITWGTCSLIDRNKKPLTEKAGVEILITGDDDTFNKDDRRKKQKTAIIYPKNIPIPIMASEKIANGNLVVIGCCNFTDYQYPDSDINMAQPGPPPFKHETPRLYDNLMKYFSNLSKK